MRKYKREYAGITAHSRMIARITSSGKITTLFQVTKDGLPDYETSAALTHKEAVKDAVLFWIKKGLIERPI